MRAYEDDPRHKALSLVLETRGYKVLRSRLQHHFDARHYAQG